jgi:hypothetical protein
MDKKKLITRRFYKAVEQGKLGWSDWSNFKQQQQEAFGFDDSASFGTIAVAVAWISPYVLTGTASNASVTVTAITNPPGTAGLAVGQGMSGTGIQAGTTIATIASITSVTMSLPANASAGTNAITFAAYDPQQSVFAQSSPFYPLPPQTATITPGSAFNVPDVQILAATGGQGAIYVPAPGRGVVTLANGTTTAAAIQYNINGVWTSIYLGTISATVAFYVHADGTNVRFNNLAATSSTFTFYRELSSKS